ncbi:MAG: 6-carboxytetrahydropterin synthase QueD [Candidatus Omnitrophota bacterium]|jgi:6-pyruvoyltetrahydropterin/6-carboxytetrahydropterin synthase
MFYIKVKGSFSAAHNLKNYKGKCEHLHGHNWAVEALFAYDTLDKDGMAVDFKLAKKMLKSVTEKLDHSYLNKSGLVKKINPTSENIARLIYGLIKKKNGHIKSVSVWENESSCAIYTEE